METVMMLGKAVAAAARTQIEASLAAAKARGEEVTLAIVTVGADPASQVYKNRLVKMTEGIGAQVQLVELAATATQSAVEEAIIQLNQNPAITGILPMMPLPPHLNADAIGAVLAPAKDVDCLSPLNAGELYLGHSRWAPCTARACMATLAHYEIALQGKNVVVLGRSNVV
ncbi:MAG: bifunctional 5,10-methylenetetrahydrofolate dehydrogenase/5,10-methenyltetrahydrofolate cyclohydrolase, partial [Acidaminococcaceae bacterium]